MLVNILVFAFVDAFVAIAALGHVLLLLAIWPVWPDRPNGNARGAKCDSARESTPASSSALVAC
jgi:hypothetical protein